MSQSKFENFTYWVTVESYIEAYMENEDGSYTPFYDYIENSKHETYSDLKDAYTRAQILLTTELENKMDHNVIIQAFNENKEHMFELTLTPLDFYFTPGIKGNITLEDVKEKINEVKIID